MSNRCPCLFSFRLTGGERFRHDEPVSKVKYSQQLFKIVDIIIILYATFLKTDTADDMAAGCHGEFSLITGEKETEVATHPGRHPKTCKIRL